MRKVLYVAARHSVPMKLKSLAQAALMRKSRARSAAAGSRFVGPLGVPLSPEEKLQERLEERRLRRAWDAKSKVFGT